MNKFSFANTDNHMIHIVLPKFRITGKGLRPELGYLAVESIGFFLAFALVPLLVMWFAASMEWPEILLSASGFFSASVIFAVMFRLTVVTHTKLKKPLNWILPSILLVLPVPIMVILITHISMLGFSVAERTSYFRGSEYTGALIYLLIAFPGILLHFRRSSRELPS